MKLDLFKVGVGLYQYCQDWSLSPFLYVFFIDRILAIPECPKEGADHGDWNYY